MRANGAVDGNNAPRRHTARRWRAEAEFKDFLIIILSVKMTVRNLGILDSNKLDKKEFAGIIFGS
jgi:hypothetical protein